MLSAMVTCDTLFKHEILTKNRNVIIFIIIIVYFY